MVITENFLRTALQALKEEIMSELHVAMPGKVESYDPETRTASVQPALRQQLRSGKTVTAPLLQDVPVLIPSPDFTITPGSHCLLIFADFCIDGWYESGMPVNPPAARKHDLSDAFALVGFSPVNRQN